MKPGFLQHSPALIGATKRPATQHDSEDTQFTNIVALTDTDRPQHNAPLLLQHAATTGPVDGAGTSADGAMALPAGLCAIPPGAFYYAPPPSDTADLRINELAELILQLRTEVAVLRAEVTALRAASVQHRNATAGGSSGSPSAASSADVHTQIRGIVASLEHILQGAGGSNQPAASQQPPAATRPARHQKPRPQQQQPQTAAPPRPVPPLAPGLGHAASQPPMPAPMQPCNQTTAPSTSQRTKQKQQQQRKPLPQQQQEQEQQKAPAEQSWQEVKPRKSSRPAPRPTQTNKAFTHLQQRLQLQMSIPFKQFASVATGFTSDRPSIQDVLTVNLGLCMALDSTFPLHITGATFVNVAPAPADWSNPPDWAPNIRKPFVVPRQGDRITIAFSMQTLAQVESLITARRQLKGTGVVLSEVLTPAETREKQALYQQFVDARQAGHKAQFKRGRLFVDGVRVLQTSSASPMPP